ncbi:hypothetical protein H072_8742 [Dactylellina haptotyla CBS 200.50]|uniref:Ubiquitin 3 binding protein But2 C-terminal domain-containing protein n=1 Tax=Dactylellina haptotyla (strain CBS 200.50) TaxID=1284197 RepID=S8BE84_DACHA|nr:hypothetical protein H072_8742 [Dactylellina haptotyla CBS 200.50]
MHLNTILAVAAAVVGVVSAAPQTGPPPPPPPPPPPSQLDGPFGLQILSQNDSWSGKYFSHAQIGGSFNLVVPATVGVPLWLNVSEGNTIIWSPNPRPRPQGEHYHLSVSVDLASNVGPLYIGEAETTGFSFNQDGFMELGGLNRFFVCTFNTAKGPMSGVSWKYGGEKTGPDGTDCSKIRFKRFNIRPGPGGPPGPRAPGQ